MITLLLCLCTLPLWLTTSFIIAAVLKAYAFPWPSYPSEHLVNITSTQLDLIYYLVTLGTNFNYTSSNADRIGLPVLLQSHIRRQSIANFYRH